MAGIDAAVKELKARRDALAEELRKIDQALEVLGSLGTASEPVRTGRKWRPGGPGRPPKTQSTEKVAGKSASSASPRKARKGKRKRKPPTEKQLAAMAKARAALAEKRAKTTVGS